MVFTLFTLSGLLALAAAISIDRFRAAGNRTFRHYFAWVKNGAFRFWKQPRAGFAAARERFRKWSGRHYPGWRRRILETLLVSTAYLAASGIGAALFFRNGMSGAFLLLHLVGGAFFAVAMSADLILRARDHAAFSGPFPPTMIVFWVFAACALLLTATALASMLAGLGLKIQLTFIGIHRYTATVLVLAALARFELAD